jgi:hypothetical protein
METNNGQIWVTYWPKSDASRTPEYLGQLYAGTLRHFVLPREPYYTLGFDYYIGPIPFVNGMQLETGKWFRWAVLPNGAVINSKMLPANLRGHDKKSVCKQGSRTGEVALYGQLPNGRWQPILSWHAWGKATHGAWHFDSDHPLECAGRFDGYFFVFYESAGTGAIYKVNEGTIFPFAVGRPYLVTDHTMIVDGGDVIIEAHADSLSEGTRH